MTNKGEIIWYIVVSCSAFFRKSLVLLEKSIQGNIYDIMEGSQEAFNLRKQKI